MNIKTCINNAGLATLWRLPPETAHNLAIWALHKGLVPAAGQANTVELKSGLFRTKPIPGLGSLPHPVCLAAGFDKNAETVRHLHNLEFAAAELGTVTPKPQEGNAKPRLFRLKEQRALINRMGFNNCGIDKFMQNLQKTARRDKMKIGVNVGKNKVTEQEKAVDDYIYCLDKTKDSADYFVVNISSPNTPGLRDLGTQSFLDELETQIEENQLKKTYIKVDPDRTKKDFTAIIERIAKKNFAGLVLSNTSTASTPEKGGLSGSPIISTTNRCLEIAHEVHQGALPTIASGGVMSGRDILEKIMRGAQVVQIYTAMVYRGSGVAGLLLHELKEAMHNAGFKNLGEAEGVLVG